MRCFLEIQTSFLVEPGAHCILARSLSLVMLAAPQSSGDSNKTPSFFLFDLAMLLGEV
jgi:hypothetical protein